MTTPAPSHPDQPNSSPEPRASRPAAILHSAGFLGHDTGGHVENPTRIAAIDAALRQRDLLSGRPEIPFGPATFDALARVHDERYLTLLQEITDQGGAWIDADTMVGLDSLETARLAAGAVVAAIEAVLSNRIRRAFTLGRPPGHHATATRAMGFCLLNNVAVGAAHALAAGVERVAVVDWDVHHGNGTQDIFYESDRVFVCSIHQSPLYPGTGQATERGRGPGEGYTLNIPLPPGQGDATYTTAFQETVLPAVRSFWPDLIIVSAGFDAHRADPLGGMRLTEAGFATLASLVVALADDVCDGRVVAVLEGGYDPPALARSVIAVLAALD